MSSLIKSLETTDSDTRERSEIQAERDGRRKGLDKTSRIEWEPIATSVSVPCHPLICRLDFLSDGVSVGKNAHRTPQTHLDAAQASFTTGSQTLPDPIMELASEEGLAVQRHQPVEAPDQRLPNSPYRPSRPMLRV